MRPPRQLLSAPPSSAINTTALPHGSSNNATANDQADNPWGPFGNAATYRADMALALGILLSGFVLGIILVLVVGYFLRCRGASRTPLAGEHDQKPEGRGGGDSGEEHPSEPPTLYSAGKTELAGAAAECAICLTEFAEGDALRVLPVCRHGFHMACVQRWLQLFSAASSRPLSTNAPAPAPSCPLCRASFLSPVSSPEMVEP